MSGFLFALWIALSAGLLVLFFYAALVNWRNRRLHNVELGELIPSFLPVDVEALTSLSEMKPTSSEMSLVDAADHMELEGECLRRMAHNAALLQRLGYSQLHSPNPLIASLAQEMIDAGVNVRLYTFFGLFKLRVRGWMRRTPAPLPWTRRLCDIQALLSDSVIPAYQGLKEKAGSLTSLKFSSLHEELAQSL